MLDAKKIGMRIKKLREDMGASREDLALKVDVTERAIVSYELGERIPRDVIKVKLSEYLNVTVSDLFYLEETNTLSGLQDD